MGDARGLDPRQGPTPGQRFGRYTILEQLGAGGMSVVYAAHDPDLDRQVALKILRPEPAAEAGSSSSSSSKAEEYTVRLDRAGNERDPVRERLLSEGRALARLSHPNLIAVFEVGTVGDQVFLSMEHVAGISLGRWLAASPDRPWRQVLSVFAQAGRGLAAAHAAGLVHGDFKPDNVVIEESTLRARVVDFGLARAAGTRSAGDVLGTPRYMAPEQRAGRAIDARADQYAFAVALHEALHGRHPDPAMDGARHPAAGAADPRGRVPARIDRALARALAVDPADRFGSMAALLARLEPRLVGRGVAVAAAALVASATALTITLFPGGAGEEAARCNGGPARLAGSWDAAHRAALERGFAGSGRPHAAVSARHASEALDRYAAAWLAMHREACLASARGEQSVDLLDRRMACLDRRLAQLRGRTDLLTRQPDGDVVDHALDLVDLAPLSECADAEALLTRTAPPADPTRRREALAIEELVDRATLASKAGRGTEALRDATAAVTRARALDHPPVTARANLALSIALEDADRQREAEQALHDGVAAAERAGDDALAATILVRMVFVVGSSQLRAAEGRTLARLAEAALGRAGDRADPDLRARLQTAVGSVALQEGKLDEAEAVLTQALDLSRELLGPDDLRVAATENILANALNRHGKYDEARAHYLAALAIRRKVLGDSHPRTAGLYQNLGNLETAERRYDDARRHFEQALAIQSRSPDDSTANSREGLGNIAAMTGEFAQAIRYHEEALAERRARLGPDHPSVALSLHNLGDIYVSDGKPAQALPLLREAAALQRRTLGETHHRYGGTLAIIGEALLQSGHPAESVTTLEEAASILTRALGEDHPTALQARGALAVARLALARRSRGGSRRAIDQPIAELEHVAPRLPENDADGARFRFALARELVAAGRDRARALDLAGRARRTFDATHRPRQRDEVDRWLARSGAPGRVKRGASAR
ncbi:MAG TPA: serine/threonine-protein kinase [Kofleriaceae bacterium]|nr:serine/threonine-protein kinase [Kofleriaceae bacterium]